MKSNLFIPKKLKIGFNNRSDTFTGKLAYVTYFDEKGVLRKEKSWDGWRDHKIDPIEIDNTPQNGFVLNKGVQRYSDWGSGRSVIRVHDPRNFEFEISVDNLIGILMHSDVSKRDIVEQHVFAWAGTELVLLPVNSDAYQTSIAYTKKQDTKLSAKSLVLGRRYALKKSDTILTYLGYHEWFEMVHDYDTNTYSQVSKGKKHVFYEPKNGKSYFYEPFVTPSISSFSGEVSEDIDSEFSSHVEQLFKTPKVQQIINIEIVPQLDAKMSSGQHLTRIKKGVVQRSELILSTHHMFKRYSSSAPTPHTGLNTTDTWSISDQIPIKLRSVNRYGRRSYLSCGHLYDLKVDVPFNTIGLEEGVDIKTSSDNYHRTEYQLSEKAVDAFIKMGYGKLVYVLKNGHRIDANI